MQKRNGRTEEWTDGRTLNEVPHNACAHTLKDYMHEREKKDYGKLIKELVKEGK